MNPRSTQALALAVLALLAGCAQTPPARFAEVAPEQRQSGFVASGPAQLTVAREADAGSAQCEMLVYVNGRSLARLKPGQMVSTGVEPGAHKVSARYAPWNCAGPALKADNLELSLLPRQHGQLLIRPEGQERRLVLAPMAMPAL